MQIKNYIDHAVRAIKDSDPIRSVRQDDAGAGLFARELVTATFAEVFRHQFPELKFAAGGLIPFATNLDEGAREYSWTELEAIGEAAIVADGADDLPEANVIGSQHIRSVKTIAIAVSYSTQDLRSARMQGLYDLVSEKTSAAREGYDRTIDRLIRVGDASAGLVGFTNAPGILETPAITGTWSTATSAQIIADFTAAANAMIENTDAVEIPDTALFPIAQWRRISTLPFDTASGPLTVLDYLKAAFPEIRNWTWESGMATAGPSDTPAVMIYKNMASHLSAVFPMVLRPLAPEPKGLRVRMAFESRFGGVKVLRPRSIVKLTGV